jgi:hypothetical protein
MAGLRAGETAGAPYRSDRQCRRRDRRALWHIPKFLTAGSAQDYPFWLSLLDSIAKAIVFTWVYTAPGAVCGRPPCSTRPSTPQSCSSRSSRRPSVTSVPR